MKRRRAGQIGGAASAAALGLVAGGRAVRRAARRKNNDVYADENFALIDEDRASVVSADDGIELAVREFGPSDAPVTAIFIHGFSNRMTSFHLQRRLLSQRWGTDVRMVFFDLRGHGLSGQPPDEHCSIDQLGADLVSVIRATAPRGPLLLVGHSMGGMTVLAAARLQPELFHDRVIGVGLLSATAAGLSQVGLGRNLRSPAIDGFRLAVRASPGVVQFGRVAARALVWPVLHAASFRTEVSPSLAKFAYEMIDETSVVTIVKFLRALELHDESDALPVLASLPTLVLSGDADLVIPTSGARRLAAALPHSELVVVHRAGHMVHLEFPDLVNDAIERLLDRALEFHDLDPTHVR